MESNSDAVEPLVESISLGRTDIVKRLLEQVLDASNERNFLEFLNDPRHHESGTFLHLAAHCQHYDIVMALLQMGADPSVRNAEDKTIFDIGGEKLTSALLPVILTAFSRSNLSLIAQLLDSGLKINVSFDDDSGCSLLHWAAIYGNAEITQLLLDKGADPDYADKNGVTPLHEAIIRKDEEVARVLVQANAVTAKTATDGLHKGQSPLDLIQLCTHEWTSEFLSMVNIPKNLDEGISNPGTNFSLDSIFLSDNEVSPKKCLPSCGRVSPLPPLITDERLNLLWPRPAFIKQLSDEPQIFPKKLLISVSPGYLSIHRLMELFKIYHSEITIAGREFCLNESSPLQSSFMEESESTIFCQIEDPSLHHIRGSYSIHVSSKKIKISAGDLHGVYFGITTLVQMFSLFGQEGLISVVIKDHPNIGIRAILIDINPFGRVPKLETMLDTIDNIAYFKINQLQAFVRIFKNDTISSIGFSEGEMLKLGKACQKRLIDFIPAIDVDSKMTLDNVLDLSKKIRSVTKCFENPKTIHIGPVLTSLIFATKRAQEMVDLLFSDYNCVMMCRNSITEASCIENVPLKVVLLQYGFKPHPNKRDENFSIALGKLQDQGVAYFGSCSGTCAWSNLAGSPIEMTENVDLAHHALNKLNGNVSVLAHWSSDPAFCHSLFAWPAYIIFSGFSWNFSTPKEYASVILPKLLDYHLLRSTVPLWGSIIIDLGRAEQDIEVNKKIVNKSQPCSSVSLLLEILTHPDDVDLEKVSLEKLPTIVQKIRKCQSQVMKWRSTHQASAQVRLESMQHELLLTAELLLLSLKIARALCVSGANPHLGSAELELPVINCGIAGLSPTFKTDIANKLLSLIEQFRAHWLSQYQPQGLHGCLKVLNGLLKILIPEYHELH